MNKKEKELTGYPSIDKPWMKYYSEESKEHSIPGCTVYDNIASHNLSYASDIALMYFGRKITYRELFDNINRVKQSFLKLGVKKGDKVILFTSSTPETIYTILACCRIGAVANMINPLFSDQQIVDRINETDSSIMIVLDQLYSKAVEIIRKTCLETIIVVPVVNSMTFMTKILASTKMKKNIKYDKTTLRWNDFIEIGKDEGELPDESYEVDSPMIMVYSSGTTGASKGIVLTNDGINATISHYQGSDFSYERGNRFLQVVPVWFSTGIVLCVMMPLCLGITVILEPVFSQESFAKNIKKYNPNMTLAATSLWAYAASCSELENMNLSEMMYPITGGDQILPKVEKKINEFLSQHGCKTILLKGYGMCELGSTVSTETPRVYKSGSTGIPISCAIVSAFNQETDEELKYYKRGEIRVLSAARMKEYFHNIDATSKYFYTDEKGNMWGCTGDIGYVDEDGFVYILGRASDNYISSQRRKIYCFDIEDVILKNPNVAQCKVVGIPINGYEVPVAHIIFEKDATETYEILEAIHKSCLNHLEKDCILFGYKICTTFPVAKNGKINMEQLKMERSGFVIPEAGRLKDVIFG